MLSCPRCILAISNVSAHTPNKVIGVLNPQRLEQARLSANFSHSDLAFEIRRISGGAHKPNEGLVRKWIKGQHKPSDGVVVAIAAATGQEISFFYEADEADDGEVELLRDIRHLPVDLRRRIESALDHRKVGGRV